MQAADLVIAVVQVPGLVEVVAAKKHGYAAAETAGAINAFRLSVIAMSAASIRR